MQKFSLPYLADWFATALRWFGLLGLVMTLPDDAPGLTLTVLAWA